MEKVTKYLLALPLALLIIMSGCQSKDATRFTPHNLKSYNLPDSIKSMTEVLYDANNQQTGVQIITFDGLGREVSRETRNPDGQVITETWIYGKDGKIKDWSISNAPFVDYRTVYNDHGDLVEEWFTFKQEFDGEEYENGYYISYQYDDDGNIVSESTCYLESECDAVTFEYEDGKRVSGRHQGMGEYSLFYYTDGLRTKIEDYSETGTGKDKLTNTYNITYEFDDNGLWKTMTTKEHKKLLQKSERFLSYYSPEEMSVAETWGTAVSRPINEEGGNFVSRYVKDVKWRYFYGQDAKSAGLMLTLIILSCIFASLVLWYLQSEKRVFDNFSGFRLPNGMKRLWMYNKEPYMKVSVIVPALIGAVVAAIIVLFLFGGLTWLVLWIVKLIMWIIVIFGWICVVGGVLGVLGRSGYGCLMLIIGIPIVAAQDWVKRTGDALVEWGFQFLQDINLFGWGANLFANFWDVMLLIFAAPLLIFLAIAGILIILDMILIGFEWIVTKIYSVRRPCPSCGHTGTPDYLVNGQKHPVDLRPGFYGVFTQKSPITGKDLPTMLMNGRGKITRRCRNCNTIINAETEHSFGTEKHIGIVGNRSSGKSYLLYHALDMLIQRYPDQLEQIDVDNDNRIGSKAQRIQRREDIQTNVTKYYRAVQLMFKKKLRAVPFHLFFYDVAGEQFNVASMTNQSAMRFYCHVESIVFIIDPAMLDITGKGTSPEFRTWYSKHGSRETYDTEGTLAVLQDILEKANNNPAGININFVLTKSDTGYLEACAYSATPSADDLERFMSDELGLSNLVNSARGAFKSVGFYAVNVNAEDNDRVATLFETVLAQRGVKL